MRLSPRSILDSMSGFITRNEKFIFITVARILAMGCLGTAIYFAWKLSRQLTM